MSHGLSKSLVLAVCALAALGVSAASGHQRAPARQLGGCPTHLDYVVLASLADSGNWVGLSTFRSEENIDWRFSPFASARKVAYGVDRGGFNCRLHREQTREQTG
jgi:hypothetical protein